jgi:hypothetical protein
MKNQKSNRRSFLKGSGAVVSSALVPAAANAAISQFDDRAEIRKLYREFVAQQSDHLRVLRDPSHEEDTIAIAADGRTATARFHSVVQNATPLVGDAPLLEMARQQGIYAKQWWESGTHELTCVKGNGVWRIDTVRYSSRNM